MSKVLATFGIVLLLLGIFGIWYTSPDSQAARETRRWEQAQLRAEQAALSAERAAQLEPVRAVVDPVIYAGIRLIGLGILVYLAVALGGATTAFFRKRLVLVQPDSAGRLPVRLDSAAYHGVSAAALGGYHATQHERARQSAAVPIHYAPHTAFSEQSHPVIQGAHSTPEPVVQLADHTLPSLTDLADLGHRPTGKAILLGLGAGGTPITVPLRNLWHIGLAGATGTGKSNIARLITAQLLTLGAQVSIADPKFTTFDAESGEDWRPIADRLHLAPASKPADIADLLSWHSEELTRRLELRQKGEKVGGPLFLYMDEWHVISEDVKDAEALVTRLSRIGRGVGMYLLTAAHSMLVRDGATFRDQFRTGYYLGGARSTGAALLDLAQRDIDESVLETGVAYLRSTATSPAQIVRVPYASNEAIYGLLTDGQPTMERLHTGAEVGRNPASPDPVMKSSGSPFEVATEVTSPAAECAIPSAEVARVLGLFVQGLSISDIAQEVYDAPKAGGKSVEARRKVEAVLRQSLGGVQR